MLWVLGSAGAVIAMLLGLIATIARWNGGQILTRMDRQDATMEEIKSLLTSETGLLREAIHGHDVRIVRLEEFKVSVQNTMHFGRRFEDQESNGHD